MMVSWDLVIRKHGILSLGFVHLPIRISTEFTVEAITLSSSSMSFYHQGWRQERPPHYTNPQKNLLANPLRPRRKTFLRKKTKTFSLRRPKSKRPFLDTSKSNLFKRPPIILSTRLSKHMQRASKMLIFTIKSRFVKLSTVIGISTLRLSRRIWPNFSKCCKFTQTKWHLWKVMHFC